IARMLVQLMGGEIGVVSEKGKGSRFWFTALFREAAARARGPRASMQLTGISVAIIDDNRTNRTILERYVSSWGMRGRSFDSGHEALHEMRRASGGDDPFEVAIVDLMMPGMDGAAVTAAVRSDQALAEMAVILLTSAGRSEKEVFGVDSEMVKPVPPRSSSTSCRRCLPAGRMRKAKPRFTRWRRTGAALASSSWTTTWPTSASACAWSSVSAIGATLPRPALRPSPCWQKVGMTLSSWTARCRRWTATKRPARSGTTSGAGAVYQSSR